MDRQSKKRAMTLVELIMALLLLSVVVMTAISMELGLKRVYFSTDIEAQLFSEVVPILTRISKDINRGIGDPLNSPFVSPSVWLGGTVYGVRIDSNNNGQLDLGVDSVAGYLIGPTGTPFQLRYYSNTAVPGTFHVLSNRVLSFSIGAPSIGPGGDGASLVSITLKKNCSAAYNLTNPNVTVTSKIQYRAYSIS